MPRRLPAGERDLAEEVLYLHSLWRRGGPVPDPDLDPDPASAPALAPIQRSDRRQQRERSRLNRALRRQERERLRLDRVLRRKIDHAAAAAAEPALAPPPPASSRETLAEAAGASAPSTANPPPPTTPPSPLAQREAVRSTVEFTNRDSNSDGGDKAEEQEAAVYFTGLFERDAWLRGHYTGRWRKGRFQCMVCAAGGSDKVGKAVRRFRGCLALVHHARDASRGRSLCGRHGRRGAHRALAAVVCRLLGWDIEKLPKIVRRRIVIDSPRATAGVQHAKNDGTGENNGCSTDDDSYYKDEESDDESVEEEEDIETGMPDPATDGDQEDSEIESNEEYAEKEDRENRMEDSGPDGDEDADEKEAANSIARERDVNIRVRLLSIAHAEPVGTPPKKMVVQKRSHVTKPEVLTPGSKFNGGSNKAKRKASALSYQGQSSISGVVKKVKVNQQPSNKGKQSKTNEIGASGRKAKRPAVAARKAKLAKKKQAKTPKGGCLNS